MIIALTGHRPDNLGREYGHAGPYSEAIQEWLEEQLKLHVPEKVITGMALGADTLWAMTALRMEVPYIAVVPFKGQEKMWPPKSQELYHYLLSKATEVVFVSPPGFQHYKMQKRNAWMVDHSDLLLGIWNGIKSGGTWNALEYAGTKEKKILTFFPQLK